MPDFGGSNIDDALDDPDPDPDDSAAALVAGGAADGSDSDGQPTEPERGRNDADSPSTGTQTHPVGSPAWAAALGACVAAMLAFAVDTLVGSSLAPMAFTLAGAVTVVFMILEFEVRDSYEEA